MKLHTICIRAPSDYPEAKDLKSALKSLWFENYSRARGKKDTSGFEHVFVGEYKRGVSGLHNWLRLYTMEKNGEADYKGFILKRSMVRLYVSSRSWLKRL